SPGLVFLISDTTAGSKFAKYTSPRLGIISLRVFAMPLHPMETTPPLSPNRVWRELWLLLRFVCED
ncbi:MAG: hypothetical protein AAB904_01860, partial [Patescibacteria group bacterium]